MSEVYYSNHPRSERFPWSLYHSPITAHLLEHLKKAASQKTKLKVLVIGPGAFTELKDLPQNCELTLLDIDARVVEDLKRFEDNRIQKVLLYKSLEDFQGLGEFDFIYAKEVIEHIEDAKTYVVALHNLLATGGKLWLSTPNYGFYLLPLLEKTILEIIAKGDGFSRKHIHPNKQSKNSLTELFKSSQFKEIRTEEVAFKMALVAVGEK